MLIHELLIEGASPLIKSIGKDPMGFQLAKHLHQNSNVSNFQYVTHIDLDTIKKLFLGQGLLYLQNYLNDEAVILQGISGWAAYYRDRKLNIYYLTVVNDDGITRTTDIEQSSNHLEELIGTIKNSFVAEYTGFYSMERRRTENRSRLNRQPQQTPNNWGGSPRMIGAQAELFDRIDLFRPKIITNINRYIRKEIRNRNIKILDELDIREFEDDMRNFAKKDGDNVDRDLREYWIDSVYKGCRDMKMPDIYNRHPEATNAQIAEIARNVQKIHLEKIIDLYFIKANHL